MPPTVGYDDELYVLTIILRALTHGLRLEVSEDRFLERFQADISFLDEALRDLFDTFRDNRHLLRRDEYLRMLERLTEGFADALNLISSGTTHLTRALAPLSEALRGMRGGHLRRLGEIRGMLREAGGHSPDEERLISDEEFRVLLADSGEEEQ